MQWVKLISTKSKCKDKTWSKFELSRMSNSGSRQSLKIKSKARLLESFNNKQITCVP